MLPAAPAPKAGAADAHAEPAGRCRPGLGVPSVADFHEAMIERKVRCLQEPTQVFGAWVAQYVDPDGLPISVGEARKR